MAVKAPMRFILLGFLASYFLWPQERPEAAQAVSKLLRQGEYQQASALADQALQQDPGNTRLLTLRGLALEKSGNEKGALSSYEAALKVDARYVPALAGAAELEYKTADDNALRNVDALLALRPGDETAHAMRAVIAWKRNDCPSAVRHFSAARNAIASEPAAMQEYGICLVRLKRSTEAVPIFEDLHLRQPANERFLFALVSTQMIAGQNSAALTTLSPLLRSEGADPSTLRLGATIEERLGNTPEAVALLRRAIVAAPDREDLYLDFSSLSFEHRSFQVGIDMVNAGLARLPRSAKLYLVRGVLYTQIGKYDKADADFASAERLDPNDTAGSGAQALARFQSDRLDEALASVEESLRKQPNDVFLHYLLAEILLRHGAQPGSAEYKRAFQAAQKAVELKPDFTLARDVLSRLYFESGDTTAAIRECRQTLETDPYDQVALYRLIRALRSGGNAGSGEIHELTKRLAEARLRAQRKEADASRYQLVEGSAEPGGSAPIR